MTTFLYILSVLCGLFIISIPIFFDLRKNNKLTGFGKFFLIVVIITAISQFIIDRSNSNAIRTRDIKIDSLLQNDNSEFDKLNDISRAIYNIRHNYHDQLINKYPDGYIIFFRNKDSVLNREQLVTPLYSELKKSYSLNYQDVELVQMDLIEKGSYYLRLPAINFNGPTQYMDNQVISYTEVLSTIYCIKDKPQLVDNGPLPHYIFFEILDLDEEGIIFSVGFRSKSLPKLKL